MQVGRGVLSVGQHMAQARVINTTSSFTPPFFFFKSRTPIHLTSTRRHLSHFTLQEPRQDVCPLL